MRPALLTIGLLIAIASACIRRIPEPAAGHTGAPQVGWVIMSGDAENPDRDFVCQSDPRTACVVPADRPDARVLAHLHIYYHAAAVDTKYTGSVRVGFFTEPHDINPEITVKAGESPGNQSVSNFTSAKPGAYTLSLAVVATAVRGGPPQNIREDVGVTVK